MTEVVEAPGPLEPEPAEAAVVFGDHLAQAREFAGHLHEFGEQLGLLGPREYPRLWTRHLLNCGILAPLFAGSVADVGSGAGLPGLVLAIQRPDVSWTLIEPMQRRVDWLNAEVDRLGLQNVRVFHIRAQEVSGGQFDMVTARAVSALRTLVPMCAPLLKPGGSFLFMKGQSAAEEIQTASKALRKAGAVDVRVELVGSEVLDQPTTVVRGTVEPR